MEDPKEFQEEETYIREPAKGDDDNSPMKWAILTVLAFLLIVFLMWYFK